MNSTIARARELAAVWMTDAEKRRAISIADGTADALEYCASEMLAVLDVAANDDEELSVAEYASLHQRAVSTVRLWCQRGKIGCRQVGRDYLIRRGEKPPANSKFKLAG